MGTVILFNLANFAHWIAFPAIAKKAAAYYDVSGWIALVKTKVKIEDVMNVEKKLISGEELDLIPTVSYAAGVPTCLIATYLIESRGLKTGVSGYSSFIKSKSLKTGEKLRKILLSHVIHVSIEMS